MWFDDETWSVKDFHSAPMSDVRVRRICRAKTPRKSTNVQKQRKTAHISAGTENCCYLAHRLSCRYLPIFHVSTYAPRKRGLTRNKLSNDLTPNSSKALCMVVRDFQKHIWSSPEEARGPDKLASKFFISARNTGSPN